MATEKTAQNMNLEKRADRNESCRVGDRPARDDDSAGCRLRWQPVDLEIAGEGINVHAGGRRETHGLEQEQHQRLIPQEKPGETFYYGAKR